MVVTTDVREISSADRVRELIHIMNSLTKHVRCWQDTQDNTYHSAIEALESKLGEIRYKLSEVSSHMNAYSEILESTSESSLNTMEMPVLEPLALRVSHLEKWVAQSDDKFKKDASLARKQLLTWRGGFSNWMINTRRILRAIRHPRMVNI